MLLCQVIAGKVALIMTISFLFIKPTSVARSAVALLPGMGDGRWSSKR